ncbi:hypothetical protein ACJX0J_015069, partial [Zea mays]
LLDNLLEINLMLEAKLLVILHNSVFLDFDHLMLSFIELRFHVQIIIHKLAHSLFVVVVV